MSFTTLLIDLDETIYPSTSGVWDAISERMEAYMHDQLNFPWEEIPALRKSLYQQYGTTLRGLQSTRHIDERDFIDYVHNIPLERYLQPDPSLREVLLRYPQQKVIFTNADHRHAGRVIDQMHLTGCFDRVIDIYDISPHCKPMPEAYHTALHLLGETDPARCAFIDDSPRNLAGARAVGLYTVQVGLPKPGFQHPEAGAHALIARLQDLPDVIAPFL